MALILKGIEITPLGDSAVSISFGKTMTESLHRRIQIFMMDLEVHPIDWVIEVVPAITTVSVIYDPYLVYNLQNEGTSSPFAYVKKTLQTCIKSIDWQAPLEVKKRRIDIPVCYGGTFGPDLEAIAERNHLSAEEVIKIHSEPDYLVYMIGFAPGFPYLGGMSEKISAPRRETPRLTIPKGSVGIAGVQTGIYPMETPGGWQLIGKTPINLFNPESEEPSLIHAGDRVHFVPITQAEFRSYRS